MPDEPNRDTLRVLMVEDSADDAELILHALDEGGFDIHCARVETAETLRKALAAAEWDVILSDYDLPRFSADEALSVARERRLDIPFIIVSGCIGEEAAVALMKAGAHDFVIKGSARLVPARKHRSWESALPATGRPAATRQAAAACFIDIMDCPSWFAGSYSAASATAT